MKLIKAITIALVSMFILYSSFNVSEAGIADIIKGGDSFIHADDDSNSTVFNGQAEEKGVSQLYYIALGVGIAAAVIVGVILGIQFIISGAEGQAKIKEKILPYIIGCIVIFGAFGIWRVTISLTQKVVPESESNTQTEDTEFKKQYYQTIKENPQGLKDLKNK